MQTKFLITLIVLLIISGSIIAQNTEYKVYYSCGNVFIKTKGVSSHIERDAAIAENSVISLARDSYVVLVNKAELPMVISEEGDYSVRKISNLYSKMKESNLTEEFFSYIAGEAFKSEDKKYVGGGVYKAVGDDFDRIKKMPDPGAFLMDTSITFEWFYSTEPVAYLKIVDAQADSLVCVVSTSDYKIRLDIGTCNLIRGKSYLWTVEDSPGKVAEKESLSLMKIANQAEIDAFYSQLKEIENTAQNPKMRKLAKIRLYVDYNVYPLPDYTNF